MFDEHEEETRDNGWSDFDPFAERTVADFLEQWCSDEDDAGW